MNTNTLTKGRFVMSAHAQKDTWSAGALALLQHQHLALLGHFTALDARMLRLGRPACMKRIQHSKVVLDNTLVFGLGSPNEGYSSRHAAQPCWR